MSATQYTFQDQPNNTVQGWTLRGGNTAFSNRGIFVACTDASGNVDTTRTDAITMAFGTNPTSATLTGTLVRNAVNGVAVFTDLAVSIGGTGFTLSASGSLTTATSNAFNVTNVNRINPSLLSGSITTTGLANGVGPYRFRGGSEMYGIVVETASATAGDAVTVYAVPPGATLASGNGAAVTTITAQPGYKVIQLANECDIYVVGTTITTTMAVSIGSAQSAARV